MLWSSTEWPYGHDGGRERAPCLPVHDDGSAACTEEGTATRWPLVAWVVMDGAVPCCASLAAAAGATAAAHGAMHLCQLAADARNLPGDRAVRWIRRRNREQGATAVTGEIDAVVLKKTTPMSEPNTELLNLTGTVHARCSTI